MVLQISLPIILVDEVLKWGARNYVEVSDVKKTPWCCKFPSLLSWSMRFSNGVPATTLKSQTSRKLNKRCKQQSDIKENVFLHECCKISTGFQSCSFFEVFF